MLPAPLHPHLKDEGADVQNAGHTAGGATGEIPVCAALQRLSLTVPVPFLSTLSFISPSWLPLHTQRLHEGCTSVLTPLQSEGTN